MVAERGTEARRSAGARDVVHFEEEGAADGAAGVEAGIFLAGEAAGVEEGDGERVADGQRDGGGGGGNEIEGAGLALDGRVENSVGMLGEGGLDVADGRPRRCARRCA